MIYQIFQRDSIQTNPWKNGHGITREIAGSARDEGLWRLSIADVSEEGAFSTFSGMQRILTVIVGDGMELYRPDATRLADKYVPLTFSGEEPVTGKLPHGSVQNFNLIYDPLIWNAQVNVGDTADIMTAHWSDANISAIYCLQGRLDEANSGVLEPNSGAIFRPGNLSLDKNSSGQLLCVDLRLLSECKPNEGKLPSAALL